MGKVVILSTGGTIAMDRTASSEHPVPSLQGQDFQQRLAQHLPDDLEVSAQATRPTTESIIAALAGALGE